MPLVTLHLVQLSQGKQISDYIDSLAANSITPITIARCVRWIIKPEQLSVPQLLEPSWDLFFILRVGDSQSAAQSQLQILKNLTSKHWSMTVGIPSRVLDGFEAKNQRLLHPQQGDVPELTGSMSRPRMAESTQGLELNNELLAWSKSFDLGQHGAISMLNLLAFKPDKGADESYRRYGKAFAESIGHRRGGDAKLVGKVVASGHARPDEDREGWAEFALAHYPSIRHFVDMIASEDYQEVNHKDRLPSLRDTCILCTTELDPALARSRSRL